MFLSHLIFELFLIRKHILRLNLLFLLLMNRWSLCRIHLLICIVKYRLQSLLWHLYLILLLFLIFNSSLVAYIINLLDWGSSWFLHLLFLHLSKQLFFLKLNFLLFDLHLLLNYKLIVFSVLFAYLPQRLYVDRILFSIEIT